MILATFYFANWVEMRARLEWTNAFGIWAALELSSDAARQTRAARLLIEIELPERLVRAG